MIYGLSVYKELLHLFSTIEGTSMYLNKSLSKVAISPREMGNLVPTAELRL